MLNIVPEEDATFHNLLFLMRARVTPERISDTELVDSTNVWYLHGGGLVNYYGHKCSLVTPGFECVLEKKANSLRQQPHGFTIALEEFLSKLRAVGAAPVVSEGDTFLLFNVSSEHNTAYFVARWRSTQDFVVYVYAREIDEAVFANIKAVDASLSELMHV